MAPFAARLIRGGQALLVAASILLLSFLAVLLFRNTQTQRLRIAAGARDGESFVIATALSTVLERHFPRVKLAVLETGGTVENLLMIEDGRASLATAQADVATGPSARSLAILYDDMFQLLVRRRSPVNGFSGLRGKVIALPRTGGQFASFLSVAAHYGLSEGDFQFVGLTDSAAEEAFSSGHADAAFRVRALGNPAVQRLVRSGRGRLMSVDHASAMKIAHPAFEPSVIPAGAYLGDPAEPERDLPTVAVHRTLVAAEGVDAEAIRAVTSTLVDDRQEIAAEIPEQRAEVRLLLSQLRRPDPRRDVGPSVHAGALQFYDKDKPSFIMAHPDYVGLMLTVFVMLSSWFWQVRSWLGRKQKSAADAYSNRVMPLMNEARTATSLPELERIRGELIEILTQAVGDLDADRLSEESFHSFRSILQIGLEVVKESRATLQLAAGADPTIR